MSRSKKPSQVRKMPLMRRPKKTQKVKLDLPQARSEAELRWHHAAFRGALHDVRQASQAADVRLVAAALTMADELAASVGDDAQAPEWTREYQEARLLANAVLQVSHWTGIAAGKPDADRLHYLRRAMLIGAELERAGLFAKGSGGRTVGSGAHDDLDTFIKALKLLEGHLEPGQKRKSKGTVFVDLAKELRARGEKSGDPNVVGPDLQRKYNRWRETLALEEVSIISNQMTCPTCGATVRADLY